MITLNQAESQIRTLGGYSKIESMPLKQRNAYGATELAGSCGLNKVWLYEKATEKGVDLYIKLQEFDIEEVNLRTFFGVKLVDSLFNDNLMGGKK